MKYGEHFEEESVPGWSLHNIDYNSLKHQIKTHTSKDQATAIAIPGQQDYALKRFEDAFYLELCNQHNRVGLFVTSKADEIARRLLHQLIVRCNDAGGVSPKRQRRLAKYALQIDECEDDIKALRRFASAQVIAFRKILKKYRKWTGSTTLSIRFKENVLSSPKSFTRRDFHPLQMQHQDLLVTLEAASPDMNSLQVECQKQKQKAKFQSEQRNNGHRPSQTQQSSKPPSIVSTPGGSSGTYWNEYEHGSEAGDNDEGAYALYIDPNASADFPGFVYIKSMFTTPVDRVRHWLKARTPQPQPPETQPLISGQAPADYFSARHSSTAGTTDNDGTEDEYASSLNSSIGRRNKMRYASLSETEADQDYQITLYRDTVLTRTVVIAFIVAFILLAISGVLIATGKHKLRLEVDAGVTVGSVASLFCACMGLGAMLYHHYPVGIMYSLAVWAAFITVCALNGMLLVLVVGTNGL
ncbi:hypothetical protein F4818DRAFT_456077 [Hypoxylon cercidicola]|nr:hypothetical protein F4818DRAFT_456077 [Hypoxylon cercidicola]